jgi:hypothetical protein
MNNKDIDAMVLELIVELDYDLAKSFDPECAEEPESIPERLADLRFIVKKHLTEHFDASQVKKKKKAAKKR